MPVFICYRLRVSKLESVFICYRLRVNKLESGTGADGLRDLDVIFSYKRDQGGVSNTEPVGDTHQSLLPPSSCALARSERRRVPELIERMHTRM